MPDSIKTLLVRNLHEVFGERDTVRRKGAIEALFSPGALFSDPHGRHVGHDQIVDAVATLQARFPDHLFTELGSPDALQDSGRLTWAFGPPDDPRRVTGMDVAVVADGRITALHTFLDAPSA